MSLPGGDLKLLQGPARAIIRGEGSFYTILEALPAAIYVADASGRIVYYNPAAAELWGRHPDLGTSAWCGSWKLYWSDGVPLPHDECPMAIAIKERRTVRGMEAIAERPDGSRIPFIPFPTPLYDDDGVLLGAVNMLVDASDRRRGEEAESRLAAIIEGRDDAVVREDPEGAIRKRMRETQKLLVDEMKHRLRSTLATVQAIAAQTMQGASSEQRAEFGTRLSALASAQDLLTIDNWNRALLGEIVERALRPFRDQFGARIAIEGRADVWIDAAKSPLVAMAMHELATNAAKYGALSKAGGEVRVVWDLAPESQGKRVNFVWLENGGPTVAQPTKRGFGSVLIERTVKAELGEVHLDFDPHGVTCVMEIPTLRER